MNKAQEILAQQATPAQKRRWAEGNAALIHQDSNRGVTLYQYADGSAIKQTCATLTALG